MGKKAVFPLLLLVAPLLVARASTVMTAPQSEPRAMRAPQPPIFIPIATQPEPKSKPNASSPEPAAPQPEPQKVPADAAAPATPAAPAAPAVLAAPAVPASPAAKKPKASPAPKSSSPSRIDLSCYGALSELVADHSNGKGPGGNCTTCISQKHASAKNTSCGENWGTADCDTSSGNACALTYLGENPAQHNMDKTIIQFFSDATTEKMEYSRNDCDGMDNEYPGCNPMKCKFTNQTYTYKFTLSGFGHGKFPKGSRINTNTTLNYRICVPGVEEPTPAPTENVEQEIKDFWNGLSQTSKIALIIGLVLAVILFCCVCGLFCHACCLGLSSGEGAGEAANNDVTNRAFSLSAAE